MKPSALLFCVLTISLLVAWGAVRARVPSEPTGDRTNSRFAPVRDALVRTGSREDTSGGASGVRDRSAAGTVGRVEDCNSNGISDATDIAGGTSRDCNGNAIPDECDITGGTSRDCNGNSVLDECDVTGGTSRDCNGNSVLDECDIAGGTSKDINTNGILDECETADCNNNGIPDLCDLDCNAVLPDGTPCSQYPGCGGSSDQNGNAIPDECDSAGACCFDAGTTGLSDTCEVMDPIDCANLPGGTYHGGGTVCGQTGPCCFDANGNGIVETCAVMDSACCADYLGAFHGPGSQCGGDPNNNGINDTCECPPEGIITIVLRSGDSGISVLSSDQSQVPLRPDPFGHDDFQQACSGPAAPVVTPFGAWIYPLPSDPAAQWIAAHSLRWPRSALFCQKFDICCPDIAIQDATLEIAFAVDDRLGDLAGEPNPDGVYINETPAGISGGGYGFETVAGAGIDVRSGENTLHVYDRDTAAIVSGVIYSVNITVECPVQACCFPTGACVMTDGCCCDEMGGTPMGPGTSCLGDADVNGVDDACETAVHACCLPDGRCENLNVSACESQNGAPQPGLCAGTVEACCLPGGACENLDPVCCYGQLGTPIGPGTTCLGDWNANGTDDACEAAYDQGCCLPDGSCLAVSPGECVAMGGQPQDQLCTGTVEACCLSGGGCEDLDPLCCDDVGGIPLGPGSGCDTHAILCCVDPPSDMVAWWPGDDCSPYDVFGRHDGTFVGFPDCQMDWRVGGGALHFFPDPDTYVTVPDHPELNFGSNGFSIDAWIKTDLSTGTTPIINKMDAGVGYFLYLSDGLLTFQLGTTAFAYLFDSTGPVVADGGWHHVAVTVDPLADAVDLYVDGAVAQDGSHSPAGLAGDSSNTIDLRMGASPASGPPTAVLDGLLDEIEIFRRALTSEEVHSIYAADRAGKCKPLCVDPPVGMVAWWPLDETAGPTAAERVAGNDGTHMGSPTPLVGQKVDNSLCFDGNGDYVEVADAPELNFGIGDLSVDAWIRTTASASVDVIVDKRFQDATGTTGYSLFLTNGELAFQLADGDGSNTCSALPTASCTNFGSGVHVADGQWRHVAVTVDRDDPNGGLWYVDGQPVGTPFDPTVRPDSLTNTNPLRIASRSFQVAALFDGCIDEVELFDRVVAPSEIASIFDAGPHGKCKDECAVTPDESACESAGCANPGLYACLPGCMNINFETGQNVVTVRNCECRQSSECHVAEQGGSPVCVGDCPPGLVCVQRDVVIPGVSIDTCCTCEPANGDCNGSETVDLSDYKVFETCITGPVPDGPLPFYCRCADFDDDDDADLMDFAGFQEAFTN